MMNPQQTVDRRCPRCHSEALVFFGFLQCGSCGLRLSPLEIEAWRKQGEKQ